MKNFERNDIMQLNIGQKIRELRRRDGRTQEMLAEALGVTSQAISRWEAGVGYPDMETVPAIANCFHISIDELFGYNSDREEKIKSILSESDRVVKSQGFTYYKGCVSEEFKECIEMLRAAADEFPNEPRILLQLAEVLHLWGINEHGLAGDYDSESGIFNFDTQFHSTNAYWQEALTVYEKLLKANPSAEERETAIRGMVPLYCRVGKFKEAKELAEAQSSLGICKEMLLPLATQGEEMMRYEGQRITTLLVWLRLSISSALSAKPLGDSEYKRKIFLSMANLFETVFEDGRCGAFHQAIGQIYMNLAHCESSIREDMEKALEYFDKGFDHYKEYERISSEGNYTYTAPLVSCLKPIEKGDLRTLGENFWQKEVKHLPEALKTELRKNKKYAICFE